MMSPTAVRRELTPVKPAVCIISLTGGVHSGRVAIISPARSEWSTSETIFLFRFFLSGGITISALLIPKKIPKKNVFIHLCDIFHMMTAASRANSSTSLSS
jgi:hypothetical protein